MRTTTGRAALLRTICLLLLMSQAALLWASGDRERDAPFAPAFGSLPGWVYESSENGSPSIRLQEEAEPEAFTLWNPEMSEGRLRIDNMVYNFEDILGDDLIARAGGLEITFGAAIDDVSPDLSLVVITTVLENAASRPRSVGLRYVLSPSPQREQPIRAFHLAPGLPIELEETTDGGTSFTPQSRIFEQETSFAAESSEQVLIPLVGPSDSYRTTAPPIVAWNIANGSEAVQYSVANRTRLLESPWSFQTGRARDFSVVPGAPPDAGIGIRFAEQTLAPGETVSFEYSVYIQTQSPAAASESQSSTDDEAVPSGDASQETETEPAPEPAADASEEAGGAEPLRSPQEEAERESADAVVPEDDNQSASPAEEQTERAFTELNRELNRLRALQQRETPPTQEELDAIRDTIERLRQELDNARRSETQE
ncbi:MAG: hypothetical protein ACOC4F_04875 [bacterium]